MLKYYFCILFFFFLAGTETAWSQSAADTIITTIDSTTEAADSTAAGTDAVAITEANEDSLNHPVMDIRYLNNYSLRQVPQREVNKYLEDPDYAYANDPEYWKEDPVENKPGPFRNFLNRKVIQWILFLAILSLILFGIYQLAKENNFKWFARRRKQDSLPAQGGVLNERIDYDEAIRKYQLEGNYRMAVRFMYLRLIHSASEKNIIQIRDSSTNAEITRAFGTHPQANEFRFLAMAYEYIFYGDFLPDQQLFEGLKTRFLAFQQALSN